MIKFGVILSILLLVSLKFYKLCYAQQHFKNAKWNRNDKVFVSYWVFTYPNEDIEDRDVLKSKIQTIDDLRRGEISAPEQNEVQAWPFTTMSTMSWIYKDIDEDTDLRFTRPHSRPAPVVDGSNPCNYVFPEKPNFNVPGRRISEAKCDDYQWELNARKESIRKSEECKEYRKKHFNETFFGPAVVGGRTTEPGEFPHMGALGWQAVTGDWKFQCGGSVISPSYVLTAAHCSSASPRDTTISNIKPEIFRLGVRNLYKWADNVTPYDGKVIRIIVHPQYAAPKKYYDIAIVQLSDVFSFLDDTIQPACLWTRFDTSPLGSRALVSGWGFLDPAGRNKATDLQAAEVDIIDSFKCDELLTRSRNRHFHGLESHQLCAGVLAGGVDTCQGDSGGPLQVKIPAAKQLSYVIGVTSFGSGCARANSPGVYTRVSSFIDWIESIVWPGQKAK